MTKVHVVAGVFGGCFDYLEVFTDLNEAIKARDAQLEAYGLTDEDKPDNQHSQECRWNDENELHLHSVELTTTTDFVVCTHSHGCPLRSP